MIVSLSFEVRLVVVAEDLDNIVLAHGVVVVVAPDEVCALAEAGALEVRRAVEREVLVVVDREGVAVRRVLDADDVEIGVSEVLNVRHLDHLAVRLAVRLRKANRLQVRRLDLEVLRPDYLAVARKYYPNRKG